MKNVFASGELSRYRKYNLNESRSAVESHNYKLADSHSAYAKRKVTVFISHKHDDLTDLQDLIGFLEEKYDVQCYIDSRDPSMPDTTSGETAKIIKKRIIDCDKFILLATNRAIASKWCNWELGFGDAHKFKKHIALFPFERGYERFDGNEYMEIYPHIVKYTEYDYVNGKFVEPGYYVYSTDISGGINLEPLKSWLES